MMEKDSRFIIDFLEQQFPDRLPLNKVSEFELGELIGQRRLINILKEKLKTKDDEKEIR